MSDSADILDDAIELLSKPKSVATPAATVTAQSPTEALKVYDRVAANEQARSSRLFRMDKLIPPGAP